VSNKAFKTLLALSFALSSALLASDAGAAGPAGTKADYGAPAVATVADYHLNVNAATKWVNVNNGDTVEFDVGGRNFTWHFDTFQNTTILNLATIAPAGVPVGAVKVFVAMNPKDMN